jgi:hypothetical protein
VVPQGNQWIALRVIPTRSFKKAQIRPVGVVARESGLPLPEGAVGYHCDAFIDGLTGIAEGAKNPPGLVGWLPALLDGRERLANARCQGRSNYGQCPRRADAEKIILRRDPVPEALGRCTPFCQCLRCRRFTGTSCG